MAQFCVKVINQNNNLGCVLIGSDYASFEFYFDGEVYSKPTCYVQCGDWYNKEITPLHPHQLIDMFHYYFFKLNNTQEEPDATFHNKRLNIKIDPAQLNSDCIVIEFQKRSKKMTKKEGDKLSIALLSIEEKKSKLSRMTQLEKLEFTTYVNELTFYGELEIPNKIQRFNELNNPVPALIYHSPRDPL